MRMGRRVCRIAPLRVGFLRVGFRVGFSSRLGVAAAPVAGVLSVSFLPVWETFCNCRGHLVYNCFSLVQLASPCKSPENREEGRQKPTQFKTSFDDDDDDDENTKLGSSEARWKELGSREMFLGSIRVLVWKGIRILSFLSFSLSTSLARRNGLLGWVIFISFFIFLFFICFLIFEITSLIVRALMTMMIACYFFA